MGFTIVVAGIALAADQFIGFDAIKSSEANGYAIGDAATDFSLKNVDGNMVSLIDYKDANGFIVIFTCNHCPYSVAYEDRIIALDKAFKTKGYPVIDINPNKHEAYTDDRYKTMI